MEIGIRANLTQWTDRRLLQELQRLFLTSAGVFGFTVIMVAAPGTYTQVLFVSAFIVWYFLACLRFLHVWRELSRRMAAKQEISNNPSEATR